MNATPAPTRDQDATGARRAAVVFVRWLPDAGLWGVACSGFALSYSSVQKAALAHVDHPALSYLLPVATDGGALAAAARYVADRRAGLAGARGWQLLAWAAIAASAALNAMGRDLQDAVWHLIGPGALAVITELYAHRAAQLRKEEQGPRESIPARLWLTSPRSSFRLWLWTARTGEQSLVEARRSMDRYAAAREALEVACQTRADRRIRNLARDQLRSGVLAPTAVLQVLGWGTGQAPKDATTALRELLATVDDQADNEAAPAVEVHVVDRPADQEPRPAGVLQVAQGPVDRPAIESRPATTKPRRTGRSAESGRTGRSDRVETGASGHAETGRSRRSPEQIRSDAVAALESGALSATSSRTTVRDVLGLSWKTAGVVHAQLPALALGELSGQTSIDQALSEQADQADAQGAGDVPEAAELGEPGQAPALDVAQPDQCEAPADAVPAEADRRGLAVVA
jgi:hypothetical protein